ncbi:MAG: DUF2059 domain-containing protein [Desulfuromonadales bacterium]|nr:DUF2059 domain-containing protein [Desulfuromonadales bacterium]
MKKKIVFFVVIVTLLLGSSFVLAAPSLPASQEAVVSSNLQAVPISAPDSPALREAAVDRYFQAIPIQTMLDDILGNITNIVPEGERKQVMDLIQKVLNKDMLEKIARKGMVKTFTAEEIDSMTKFYSSPTGRSILKKTGVYMQEIMPELEGEIVKSISNNPDALNTSNTGTPPSKPAN